MPRNSSHQETLIAYLLGEVESDIADAMEEKFMTDDALFEELLAAEVELRDDFAAGHLSERRKTLFEGRFLTGAGDQEAMSFSRTLTTYAQTQEAQEQATRNTKSEVLKRPRWRRWAAFALAGVLVPTLAVLFMLLNQPAAGAEHASLALVNQGLRGDQAIAVLPQVEQVTLRLPVVRAQAVSLRLLQGDRELPSPTFVVERSADSQIQVLVTIRPEEFAEGIYELELSLQGQAASAQSSRILGYYSFQKGR